MENRHGVAWRAAMEELRHFPGSLEKEGGGEEGEEQVMVIILCLYSV